VTRPVVFHRILAMTCERTMAIPLISRPRYRCLPKAFLKQPTPQMFSQMI
jgi:hypothetical protein